MLRNPGFEIEVVQGNALDIEADVLMLKFARTAYGLDMAVISRLQNKGIDLSDRLPGVGKALFIDAPAEFNSRYFLFVGTAALSQLGYQEIHDLAYTMLTSLSKHNLNIQHVAATVHGVNSGLPLDEAEIFRSMLVGFADAAEGGLVPKTLRKITIVERDPHRAELFKDALQKFLPPTPAADEVTRDAAADLASILMGSESLDEEARKPLADESTPHIFVAMPFADEFDDHYYLAIRPAITGNEVLCVRLDQDDVAFTGDIMEQVKERIRSAQLVVALLDTRNPNVYLEVGYAWGVGTPVLLVLHEEEDAPFDVQGAKLLTYRRMHKLKDDLMQEIRRLMK